MPVPDDRPPASLAAAADVITGWVTITTGSMVPLIRPGDAVDVQLASPRLGDIILVGHDGHLLLHRVLRIDDAGLWLGGDATASWEGPFPIQEWPVVVARRRLSVAQPLLDLTLARWQRWSLPRFVAVKLLRRLVAKLFRQVAGFAESGG
jgi:hypothetical protein